MDATFPEAALHCVLETLAPRVWSYPSTDPRQLRAKSFSLTP